MAKKSGKKKRTEPIIEKPKAIEITSVKLGRKTISIAWTQGDASFDLCERDNPLPQFYPAFAALAPVVGVVCHFPKKYAEEGLRVIALTLGEKGGVGTITLRAKKDIDDAQNEFGFSTPTRLLAHPIQEGKYTPPLAKEDAALVDEAIEQAKAYVRGERAQGQIAFEGDDDDADDPDEGERLPGLNDGKADPA